MKAEIRRLVTVLEETFVEGGRPLDTPVRRATATAVIRNPHAAGFAGDLSLLSDIGEELGDLLTRRAVAALGVPGPAVESFGKAALVGEDGELEHAAAILHPKLGAPVRAILGGGAALIPSSKKRGGVGAPFDVPLGHKDAARVRSHFDGIEVRVPDAPRAGEIVVALALATGGRPHPRVGGLTVAEIEGKDGLR